MRDVPYQFDAQFQAGEDGVGLLMQSFPDVTWKKTDGRKGDILGEGVKYEVKTDYKFAKTGNLFVERVSNDDTGAPGGPWQADGHGCQGMIFVCPGVKRLDVFMYGVKDLIRFVEALVKRGGYPLKYVPNPTYMTRGYAIRPAVLDPVCILKVGGEVA